MKKLSVIILLFLIIASCRKENDDSAKPDQNKLRIHTATTYNQSGALCDITHYSYYDDGMIKRIRDIDVYDTISSDTSANNIRLEIRDFVREGNTIRVYDYYEEVSKGRYWHKDTTTIKLDDRGLAYDELRVGNPEAYGETVFWYTKYFYNEAGFRDSSYSVMYKSESINPDTITTGMTEVNIIANDNCISTRRNSSPGNSIKFDYFFDYSNINTMNTGCPFYGRFNKNPVIKTISEYHGDINEGITTYEYENGKIVKIGTVGLSLHTEFTYVVLE